MRILIVDDEPAIRDLLSFAFASTNYEVRTAAGPYEAMKAFDGETFDAILSDVQMPEMDGHSLVRWLAAAHPETRSVLMSGLDIQCGRCPFTGRCTILMKPFRPMDAVAKITQALARSAAQASAGGS